jgi:hypothetical protein
MLEINKNTVNNLFVTVSEETTISGATYLMQLFSNDNHTNKVVRFTGDTSTNKERINIFQLTETTSANEDLDNAWINLMSASTYDYTIFETSIPTGTTITGLNVVETGLLKVSGNTSVVQSTFTDSNDTITFK